VNILQALGKGAKTTERLQREFEKDSLSIIPGTTGSKSFREGIKAEGITARQTPAQFAGAYAARVATDLTNDGTRMLWWRTNHPNAIADMVGGAAIGKQAAKEMGPLKTGLINLAALGPGIAVAGAYDLTNVGELFRPKGFAQNYSPEGTDDRRQTEQPLQEGFERLFLGRTGQPLKYETAKQDIPSLTPERYGNYMRSYYQDNGMFGIVKATTENLQGYPEVRLMNYPVTIPSALGVVGGAAAAGIAARSTQGPGRFRKSAVAGLAGSLGGILTGNVINEVVAAGNRPKLPTTAEYENMQY
jgi:hypothetical protein